VIVVLGVIVVMVNQVSEMVARHKAKDPDPPLHKEYVSRAEHDALVEDVNQRFQVLSEDRRQNVIKLHEKIEGLDRRHQEASNALRREVKTDIEGVHARVTDLLRIVAELSGSLRTALKNSTHPFSK
jgi:hypothetical protein